MFGFPSRHRRHQHQHPSGRPDDDSTFSAEFVEGTGLHPTLKLRLSSRTPPSSAEDKSSSSSSTHCSPHAYLTLPRAIFADRYQLSDPLFLASKKLTALRYISSPVDLEAPEYAVGLWGSSVLLELAPPPVTASPDAHDAAADETWWTAEIPLHLRYLAPAAGGYGEIDVPYPVVFWACAAEEGTKFPTNPFERANLGYDGLFGPRTVFWHVDPQPAPGTDGSTRLLNRVRVPVLDLDKSDWVSTGTAAVVLLGFLWVVWKLCAVVLGGGAVTPSPSAKKPESKKTQ